MSEQKSALDKLIESTSNHWPTLTPKARAELAALRESEKYWQAQAEEERANAAGQRDRAEELRATIAKQARRLEEARNNVIVLANYCEYWLLSGRTMTGTNDQYILKVQIESSRAWLAANAPAPQAEQFCECICPGIDANRPGICPTCGKRLSYRIDGDPDVKIPPQAEQEKAE